jgi:hypothetical protein
MSKYLHNKPTRCTTFFHFIADLDENELAVPSHPGPPKVNLEVKQVPFATLYTPPPDDGLQIDPKHVEAW